MAAGDVIDRDYTMTVAGYQFGFQDCSDGLYADPSVTPPRYTETLPGPVGSFSSPVSAVGSLTIFAVLIVIALAALTWQRKRPRSFA